MRTGLGGSRSRTAIVPIRLAFVAIWLICIAGCSSLVTQDAQQLAQAGQDEQALKLLDDALQADPRNRSLRSAQVQQREVTLARLANQADKERVAGHLDTARALLVRAQAIDATHPRVVGVGEELERASRHEAWLAEARSLEASGALEAAQAVLQRIVTEAPGHPAARAMQIRLRERMTAEPTEMVLGPAFQRPVRLEFRDAPLRNVMESLGRTSGVNFVFDKEVRGDSKVTVYLKDVGLDDAIKVILSTQQLDRKLLNDSTLLIYPNTQAKQREHQELVTKSIYLNTADAKQAQTLIRTIAKTRDMFIDERLNMLVIRDTPEVVRLAEQLIASIDLPDPEVVLEVEVMEVGSNRVDELGLQWPEQVSYGLPGGVATADLGERGNFRASIANPALLATMRESVSRANVLANPRLRARNHEKAKVLIGEKLPVFTTTSTANVGVSASVNYLDVGLKLEVEPSVQLDGDVIMRVNLEVSALIGKVLGPQGSVAYQIGTRQATTSLRLRDGETQVLAGLIRDEDTKGIAGVPGLASTPIIGRLFGLHTDARNKTEVILLITPRVVRNIGVPDHRITSVPAGVDASPGAPPMRLQRRARVGVPLATGSRTEADGGVAKTDASAAGPAMAVLALATSGQIEAGATAAVTLQNRSAVTLKGELEFDAAMLEPAQAGAAKSSRLTFLLAAGAEKVFMLRALPAAEGKTTTVSAVGVGAAEGQGAQTMVQIQGDGQIVVGKR